MTLSRVGWGVFALVGAAGCVFIALQPASPRADPTAIGTLHAFFWIAAAVFGFVGLALMFSSGPGTPATASPSATLEALYEPDETTVDRSEWSYKMTESWLENELSVAKSIISGYDVFDASQKSRSWTVKVTLALTQERLYLVWFKGHKVSEFQAVPLASIATFLWSFDKTKTTTGVHTGYTFSFAYIAAGQATSRSLWAEPHSAEPFIEQFKAAMARYVVLAAPIDIATQIRSLQALVNEGILTAEEMRRAKDLFLGRPPDQRQLMERNLRSLHELRKTGVLNQIEFDIKKQDILAELGSQRAPRDSSRGSPTSKVNARRWRRPTRRS